MPFVSLGRSWERGIDAWSVDDVFSAPLMKHFYAALARGESKADALEDAQPLYSCAVQQYRCPLVLGRVRYRRRCYRAASGAKVGSG